MNPLTLKKQALILESHLNRAALGVELSLLEAEVARLSRPAQWLSGGAGMFRPVAALAAGLAGFAATAGLAGRSGRGSRLSAIARFGGAAFAFWRAWSRARERPE